MILQKLKAFLSAWLIRGATPKPLRGAEPRACYIHKLPPDILEEIIRIHLALTPGNHYSKAIQTLSLVHRSWLPTTRYLAYVKVAFIPKSVQHATRMLEHLKTCLPPAPAPSDDFVPTEQSEHASCRTLFVGIIKPETLEIDEIGLGLFQLVSHSLWTLEFRGLAGSFWGPGVALTAASAHTPFLPHLRQLRVLDVRTWILMAYLYAIWKGAGTAGPGGFVVHHDFELSRERDLLSVPVDAVETGLSESSDQPLWQWGLDIGERLWASQSFLYILSPPSNSDERSPLDGDNQRPALELYISRRSHVGEFVRVLPEAKILVNVLKRSIKTVDVWLKDKEEVGPELAFVIERRGWEHFIDRDVADGETTHSLLHEF